MSDHTITRPLISIDTDYDGRVVLTIRDRDDHEGPMTVVEMEPGTYLDLMRGLANGVQAAVDQVVRQKALGDCERCKNVRMVDVPRPGGNTWQEHCPECSQPDQDYFARPRIGGGVR